MFREAISIFVLGLAAYSCQGKAVTNEIPGYEDPSLYDDIRLTPTQEAEMKERGFYTYGKWPKSNGVVTVPYFFDTTSFPEGDAFRGKFKEAAAVYKANTCIEWVEVPQTDTRHKVKILKDGGCWSYVGRIGGDSQELSLDDGCHSMGTMLHEMGHCMGLFHTQSRPDRDSYVKPWLQNVSPGTANNFDRSTGETFGIPYDYMSMMHYGRNYFSVNGSFTLTTLDPFALYAIGSRPDGFRYSDSAFLNKGYDCIADYTATCGEKNCLNGGFVGKDCNCRCPENTSGATCETNNGPLFADKPLCGGEVTTERDLTPNGYPSNPTSDKCIFAVKAPKCKLPAFTFSEAKFYWTQCSGNSLALEVSKTFFGYVWCDQSKVPLGKAIVSETQNANLYFSTWLSGWSGYGFKARVTFVDDPSCGPTSSTTAVTTTTSTTTTTATTTTKTTTAASTASSTTTTTVAPSSICRLTETAFDNFVYQTTNYPSAVASGASCSFERKAAKTTDLVFLQLGLDYQGRYPDNLDIKDPMFRIIYSYSVQTTEYSVFPLTINYKVGSSVAKGFKITAKPVTGLPTPCNGEEITLASGQIRTISNPLINMTEPDVRCAFKVTAPTGRKIAIRPITISMTGWERLKITPYLPNYDYYYNIPSSSQTSWGNTVIVYYTGSDTYSKWTVEFKAV